MATPVGLEIPIATNGSGGLTLPLLLDDPVFIGVELGLQTIVANDVFSPKFDLSSGLSLTSSLGLGGLSPGGRDGARDEGGRG
ncbi:MAG: hypothetical protein ACI9EF_001277 [Pseudohongiellaceae bacterium]|jgi:hypothetical protein